MKILLAEDDVSGAIMPPFLVKHHISSQPDFKAFTGKHDLFAFAKRVKQVLRESGDCAFAPILRIDTFETQTLELKVNEVESLEACAYYSGQLQPDGRRAKPTIIGDLEVFRGSFFEHKVIQLIKLALDTYF
jgi:hypothetical protein